MRWSLVVAGTAAARDVAGRARAIGVGIAWLVLLGACANNPPPPDWQMNAKGALERATEAYLSGNDRVEAAEFARARAELARTGRADSVAGAELVRCATRVASLVFDDCPGFAALAQDASAAQQAYADYLAGKSTAQSIALLPPAQRDVAAGKDAAAALGRIDDALSRLVAAGVLLRAGRAEPAVFPLAVETASSQGWRRPLLAWLNVQLQRMQATGERAEAERLRRRIELVTGTSRP